MVNIVLTASGARGFGVNLDRWTNRLGNMQPAFDAIADWQAQEWREQFNTQGAHLTQRWAPLSPAYREWKAIRYPGQPILVRTGRLRRSLTSRPFGIEEFRKGSVRLGTDVPYGAYHQRGTRFMPRRQLYPTTTENRRVKEVIRIMQRYIVTGRPR